MVFLAVQPPALQRSRRRHILRNGVEGFGESYFRVGDIAISLLPVWCHWHAGKVGGRSRREFGREREINASVVTSPAHSIPATMPQVHELQADFIMFKSTWQ